MLIGLMCVVTRRLDSLRPVVWRSRGGCALVVIRLLIAYCMIVLTIVRIFLEIRCRELTDGLRADVFLT